MAKDLWTVVESPALPFKEDDRLRDQRALGLIHLARACHSLVNGTLLHKRSTQPQQETPVSTGLTSRGVTARNREPGQKEGGGANNALHF